MKVFSLINVTVDWIDTKKFIFVFCLYFHRFIKSNFLSELKAK